MKKLVIAILLAACSADESTAPAPQQPAAPAPVVSTSANWRERIAADIATLDAARKAELYALAPQTTRAGTARFTTEVINDPSHAHHVAAVFIDRLARQLDDEATRGALAEALPRTGGVFADAVAELVGQEGSQRVRAIYVHGARRAHRAELGVAIVRRGFADSSVDVRAEAARTAAALGGGNQLASELRTALADSDPSLRTEAARSLGILKIAFARDELGRALGDANADVRLEAMRALDRITPGSLAGTAAVTQLANDPDERVSRLAQKLSTK